MSLPHGMRVLGLLALLLATAGTAQAADNPLQLKADHITASVSDIDRAVAWYQDILGFKVTSRGARANGTLKFAELAIPGFGIGLVQIGAAAPAAASGSSRTGWIHIVFSVPDANAAYVLLKSRGAAVSLREGAKTNPVDTFLIRDSEGNEIEVVNTPR